MHVCTSIDPSLYSDNSYVETTALAEKNQALGANKIVWSTEFVEETEGENEEEETEDE